MSATCSVWSPVTWLCGDQASTKWHPTWTVSRISADPVLNLLLNPLVYSIPWPVAKIDEYKVCHNRMKEQVGLPRSAPGRDGKPIFMGCYNTCTQRWWMSQWTVRMIGLILAHLGCMWMKVSIGAVRCVMPGHRKTQVLAEQSVRCATRVYFQVFSAHLPAIMVSI